MTSKGALSLIKEEFISNIENEETNDCWNESDKEADIVWWKEKFEVIEKDLKALDDFIKLFEGENLDGWIEFDFNLTREPEDSFQNSDGYVDVIKRIRKYLEGVKKND